MRPIKQPLRPFVNAQAMATSHPDIFQAPSAEELAEIHRGQFVRVCVPVDTMGGILGLWTEVISVDENIITAEVNQSFPNVTEHNLRCGDLVQFKLENVYQIMD